MKRIRAFLQTHNQKVRANKVAFAVYSVMSIITVSVIVLSVLRSDFESTFTASLTLILFLLPSFVEESFHIKLPTTLQIIAILFAFCANILGEIGEFYTLFPFWDDMLHYISGFIFAAFGFSLADIFNRNSKVEFHLSPFFLATVALCFSVTVGVLWEFFEFSADMLLQTDMQKDSLVYNIFSALLNEHGQAPLPLEQVVQSTIITADGEAMIVEGYLDIGLLDTMKDLFIDFAGAFLFCVFGYFYSSNSKKGRIAKQFVPMVSSDGSYDSLGEN